MLNRQFHQFDEEIEKAEIEVVEHSGGGGGGAASDAVGGAAGGGAAEDNRVAVACVGSLSAMIGVPRVGSSNPLVRASTGGDLLSGAAGGMGGKARPSGLRRARMSIAKVTGHKERLVYYRVRTDLLEGKLKAIDRLRTCERWTGLTVVGDPEVADHAWNMGREPNSPNSRFGRFCTYCAQRNPPVLARHRYIECMQRMLSGDPEYCVEALAELTSDLSRREAHTERLLSRFESVVEKRKQCKALLDETVDVCHSLKKYGEIGDDINPPEQGTSRVPRPICKPKNYGYEQRVRQARGGRIRSFPLAPPRPPEAPRFARSTASTWPACAVAANASPRAA